MLHALLQGKLSQLSRLTRKLTREMMTKAKQPLRLKHLQGQLSNQGVTARWGQLTSHVSMQCGLSVHGLLRCAAAVDVADAAADIKAAAISFAAASSNSAAIGLLLQPVGGSSNVGSCSIEQSSCRLSKHMHKFAQHFEFQSAFSADNLELLSMSSVGRVHDVFLP